MLDLGPFLSFALLDLALGLVEGAAFIEPGICAAPRRDLPDDLTTFMLFALLDTGVSSVRIHCIFFTVQQLGDLRDISHVSRSAMDMMNQPRLRIGADMRLHAEEALVSFLRLMHLGVTLSFPVLGRAGGMNDDGINDDALAQGQAFVLQMTVDDRKDRKGQLMLFQQMPEVHDRGVFKKARNSVLPCWRLSRSITSPVATSKAANSEVVPCRL